MIRNSEEIAARLIERRDEYRKKRKRILLAASTFAGGVLLIALIALLPKAGNRKQAEAQPTERPVYSRTAAGDPWFGEEYASEGWFNDPLDGKAVTLPFGVCVRLNYRGEDMIYNMGDRASLDRLAELICSLENADDLEPLPGKDGIEFIVMFSQGRRLFRMTQYSDGRLAANDRGCLKLCEADREALSELIERQAYVAVNTAKRSEIGSGPEMIAAYTVLPEP